MNTVFRTPGSNVVESYPVAIFDGTGSMGREYESAVQAYLEVFSNERKGMKEFQYQFAEQDVHDLLPFKSGWYGNITKTFLTVFEQLLQNKNKLPKSLTIIFVSDGQEEFDLNALKSQIEVIKQNFFISFISLAVGGQFPLPISNDLREALHNQKKSIQSIFTVERSYSREETAIFEDFKKVFTSIKELTVIQEGQVTLSQPVQLSLISEPTNVVPSNTVVFSKQPNIEIKTQDGKTLEPSKDKNDTFQLIEVSVQEAFIQGNRKDIQEQMKVIQKDVEELLQSKQIKKDENIVQLDTKIMEVLELVDDIAVGNLKVDKLTEDQKTKIQEAVMSEEKSLQDEVIKYVEVVSDPKKLTAGVVSKRISEKYKQVGCYVRGKKSQIQQNLSKLELAFNVMKDTLQNCIQVVESNQQQDVVQLLTEYKNQTFISLNKVFQDQEFKIEKEDEIVMLKQMNELFELINKVIIKQISPNDFISTVKAIKTTQQSTQSENIVVSMTIFNSDADFNFLPQELRLLVKEEIDLEEAQKVFILIVDQNPSMNQESDVAIQRFQQQFKDVPEDKKLIITWKEKQFYLHKDQNVQQQQQQIIQGTKFDTLLKCLSSVEQEFDLKNRRLFLCLVSDGETEYLSMHREFKVVKFHYSIQLIYLAVGRKLFARIENELKQKYAMRNVKGAPELINIPRSLVVSTNAGQKIGEQFSQKFESLVKKVLG